MNFTVFSPRPIRLVFALMAVGSLEVTAQSQVPFQQIAADPLRVEELVKTFPELEKGRGFLVAAQVLLQRGDLARAESSLDKAGSIAESLKDPDLIGRCCMMRGGVAEMKGDLVGASKQWDIAAQRFDECRQFQGVLEASSRKAIAEERQGRHVDSIKTLAFLRDVAVRENLPDMLAEASAQKARLHVILTQTKEAKESYAIADQILRPAGTPPDLARLDTLNAGILGLEGQNDEALKLLDKSFKFYASNNNSYLAGNCRYNGALILQTLKKPDESNAWLSDAIYYYSAGGQPGGVANAIAAQGGNYLEMNSPAVAETLLQQAYRMHQIGGNSLRKAEVNIALARCYQRMGLIEKVEPALLKAAEFFNASGLEERGKSLIATVRAEAKK
jgi:tetratricopeptide (TPR) repeat protein